MSGTLTEQGIRSDQIAALTAIDTPTIANALETPAISSPPCLGPEIRAVTPTLRPVVGIAVTATFSEQRGGRYEHLEGWLSFSEAIAQTRL